MKSEKVLIILSVQIFILSACISILFDVLYRLWDIRIFNMEEMWKKVPFPHPEMFYPLLIICYIMFVTDRFSRFVVLVKRAEFVSERLKQENIKANYNVLKNQVDPHFFFNSLSVLTSMIHTDPDLATKYVYNLSKLYRYTLEIPKDNLILLEQELEFVDSYIFLMKIRHEDNVIFKIDLSEKTRKEIGIHPNSLQLLIENAIKHNTFKKEEPLLVEIFEDNDYIYVRNSLRIRNLLTETTKIGLENIIKRYALHDNKKVIIEKDNGFFIVKLPKIELSAL